jgi:hypothetical protein
LQGTIPNYVSYLRGAPSCVAIICVFAGYQNRTRIGTSIPTLQALFPIRIAGKLFTWLQESCSRVAGAARALSQGIFLGMAFAGAQVRDEMRQRTVDESADAEAEESHVQRAQEFLHQQALALAIRRRQIAAALEDLASGGQGPQGQKCRDDPVFSWESHMRRLSDAEFKLRYRLSRDGFKALLGLLRVDLEVENKVLAKRAKFGALVPPEAKLAIALRFLAGGSPLDLRLIYCVSKSYVYHCIWLVIDAVNKALEIDFPIDDPQKLKILEEEFAAASRGGIWRGQVGALDGVHFAQRAPSKSDVDNAMKYFVGRKDKYALLCMAICDARRRIIYYDISQAPTTHDSLAWGASKLGRRIMNGELPKPYFINADAAFSLSDSVITPSGGEDDDFDFHQSSNRMPIECAFGILIKRWGLLWRPLTVRFDRRAPLIGACMRLHNFCIDSGIADETEVTHGLGCVQPGRWAACPKFDRDGRPVEHLYAVAAQRRRASLRSRSRRDELMRDVAESLLIRPRLAAGKHRKKRGRGRGRGIQKK